MWWFIVLARGVVRLKVMPPDWAQTGVGVAEFVDGLPRLLADMLGAASPKPRICFTDRGPGLYNSLTGEIVEAYHAALVRNGFRAFAGADGSQQPADLADFFLHETVVAWVRKWFSKHPFKAVEHVDESLRLFLERLHECERHSNDAYDVHGLCHDTVKRLHTLRDLGGARSRGQAFQDTRNGVSNHTYRRQARGAWRIGRADTVLTTDRGNRLFAVGYALRAASARQVPKARSGPWQCPDRSDRIAGNSRD